MKKERSRHGISAMFDQISSTYDRANRVMTLRLDQHWRKQMISLLPNKEKLFVLDCATGTADQLIVLMEHTDRVERAIGVDLAEKMIAFGQKKVADKSYAARLSFQVASALDLPFAANTFDCVTISFGIRNVTDVNLALCECHRVLKPNGRVLILEGTVPKNRLLKSIHLFYLRHILPRVGGWISSNRDAYRYLNETIETFPSGEAFCTLMKNAGFAPAQAHPLTGGIATIYSGDKSTA